ncbi:MAG TPA: hypothetical protein VFQ82_14060, partial [Stellaceae bacterium]|nr:hypothetical protein [Stellaceae bacterium]
MNKALLAGVAAVALVGAGAAHAGNIVLTGHDNDFHLPITGNALAALTAEFSFVRNGSALPVLVLDDSKIGSELVNAATTILGAANVVHVDPVNVTAADFDITKYSAFAVASVTSCGGCDNTPADIAAITAQSAAIATFFNDGGGILGLAGANDPSAYAYVPEAATNPGGSPPRTGYVQTAAGAILGLPAVDGDTTHNFFDEPGTGGLSASYVVTERLRDPATGTPE